MAATGFWAAKQGPRGAERRVGRGPNARSSRRRACASSTRALAQDAGPRGEERGRRGGRPRRRGEDARGRVRGAVPRPRDDGAAQLRRRPARRPLRDLDRHAVPDDDRDAAAGVAGPAPGAGADPHDVPRRRLRPARDARRTTSCARPSRSRRPSKAPVKVIWTREDDIRGGYYRPMWHDRMRGGRRRQRRDPVAWSHTIVGQSILAGTPFETFMVKDGIDDTSVEGAADLPLRDPNLRVELHSPQRRRARAVVALGRPLAHGLRDRVLPRRAGAHAARQGPARVPARAARSTSRATGACSSCRRRGAPAGASRCRPGRARGIAVHESFGSFVAQVAEVSLVGRGRQGAPRRVRDRLRPDREPRHDRGADRGRRRLRPDRRALRRDHAARTGASSSPTSTTTPCCA